MNLECDIVRDLYILHKEDDLSRKVKEAVDGHLSECKVCNAYYTEQNEYSKIIDLDKELLEPSNKLDEKLMLKLKLRKLRILLIFLLSVILIYSYFNYINQRNNLISELKYIEQSTEIIESYMDREKFEEKNRLIVIKDEMYDIYENNIRITKYLNFFEKQKINNSETSLDINAYFYLLNEQMNQKYFSGELTNDDKLAMLKLRKYFIDYNQLLASEIIKLEQINYNSNLKAKFNTLNIKEMSDITNQINQLSLTYYKYNKFPNEIEKKSEETMKEILLNTFNLSNAEVTLDYHNIEGTYTFKVINNNKHILGSIDAYTGQIINFIDTSVSVEGNNVITEKDAIDKLEKSLKTIFGDDVEYSITSLGLNYDFERNMDVSYDYNFNTNEDVKLYTYNVALIKDGNKVNSEYIMRVNARTGDLAVMYLGLSYYSKLFGKTIPFNTSDSLIPIEEGYSLFVNEETQQPNYKYDDTLYIRSRISGNYELMHIYKLDTTAPHKQDDPYERYLNAHTGKEDYPY